MAQAVLSTLHKSEQIERLLSNQPIEGVSETESEVKGAFKLQDKCLFSRKQHTIHFFYIKYNHFNRNKLFYDLLVIINNI